MTKEYYGTKRITAWEAPGKNDEPGYGVKYEDGYQSWSPKEAFEKAYQPLDALSFGHAILAAEAGHKIARKGWNGKGMFVVMMEGLELPPHSAMDTHKKVNDRTSKFIGPDTALSSKPYFAMYTGATREPYAKNATAQWQPGWLASQADMLANDWTIVEERKTI